MIKNINKKVNFDIHPDGDIFVWNKKTKKFEYIGFIVDEEICCVSPALNPVADRFYKALKK